MKTPFASFFLLSVLAAAAAAEEPPTGGDPALARPAGVGPAPQVQIGTHLTDRVMNEISSKVADDLELRIKRDAGAAVNVRERPDGELLVSRN